MKKPIYKNRPAEAPVRLQKYLSSAGVCSRRKGEEMIVAGRVSVNGAVVTELGTKVDPGKDRVAVDGTPVQEDETRIYIALHKPAGTVTSCRQPGDPVVVDLVDVAERVYPVGRLDKDSTGLLLLTNDGRIHHRLSHPSFDHEKEYEVKVDRPMSDADLSRMAAGMPVLGSRTRPAEVERISGRRFRIVLKEGRNRQIRRMVRKLGRRVVRLKRIRVAGIRLGRLAEGKWRYLSRNEIRSLLSDIIGSSKSAPPARPQGKPDSG
ncbi:MAG: pseudouridine synthase [Desulfobacterales bacterium]|jgi:23S rRNA pseudouridine2605 synthase/23S rRNA pseudouridine2604 synthase